MENDNTVKEVNEIELTENENQNFKARISLITSKDIESSFLQRELSMYFNEVIAKYGQSGKWKFINNKLIRVKDSKTTESIVTK